MTNKPPLPTLFYPFIERCNWKYWYQLSNGDYIIKDRATLPECIQMYCHCKRCSIPFKATPRSEKNILGTKVALTLLVLNRVKSDNIGESPKSRKIDQGCEGVINATGGI